MPRTGETYTLPPDVKGAPNTPILSAPYNAVLDDFAKDANTPRPVSAGGTGAQTRQAAVNNLFEGNSVVKDTNLLVAAFGNTTKRFRLDVGAVPDDTTRTVTMPSVSFSISDVVAPILGKPLLSDVQKALGISLKPITKNAGGTYSAVKADNAAFWNVISNGTISLAPAATLGEGWSFAVHNSSNVNVLIDPDGSETINNVATVTLANGASAIITCDGVKFRTLFWDEPLIADKITAALATFRDTQGMFTKPQGFKTTVNGGQVALYAGSDNIANIQATDSSTLAMGSMGFALESGTKKFQIKLASPIQFDSYLMFSLEYPNQFLCMGNYAYPRINGAGWRADADGTFDLVYNGAADRIRFLRSVGGVQQGSIATTVTGTAYNTTSDYRLKPIVESLMEVSLTANQFALLPDALRRVMALRPVRHNWENAPNTWTHGFIAHEAQPIIPHAVTGEKDAVEAIGTATIPEKYVPETVDGEGTIVPAHTIAAVSLPEIPEREAPEASTWEKTGERPLYQGIDPSKMVADLTAAIQGLTLLVLDQQARIDALEARP